MPAITITDLNNAKTDVDHIADIANSTSATATDRLGHTKKTIKGVLTDIENDWSGQQAEIQGSADLVLSSIGYAVPVNYTAGIVMMSRTQTIEYNGEVYAPKSANLPFTTSNWGSDAAKFRLIQGVVGAELSDVGGAALVGSIHTAGRTLPRTVADRALDCVSVFEFMTQAERNDVRSNSRILDMAPALQRAISGSYGRTLFVPYGYYLLKQQVGGSLLNIINPICIVSQFGANFLIDGAVTNTTDIITINPSSMNDEGVELENIWIYENSGIPGRHIIKINLDATHGLKKLRLNKVLLRAKAGLAIWCENPSNANTNGLSLSSVTYSEISGGIKLDGLGDSNVIADNTITGPNVGVEFTMLNESSSAGSSAKLQILRNNITSTGGAILGSNARGLSILDNNIEQLVSLDNGYSVALSHLDAPVSGPAVAMSGVSVIARNKIEVNDPLSQSNGVYLYKCNGTVVESNGINSSARPSTGTSCITLQACNKVVVRHNGLYPSARGIGLNIDSLTKNTAYTSGIYAPFNSTAVEVNDDGIGTKGVWKTGTLAVNWSRKSASTTRFAYIKNQDNVVHLRGCLGRYGATVDGETIATLPSGFLPEDINVGVGTGGNVRLPTSYVKTSDSSSVPVNIRILPVSTGVGGQVRLQTPATSDLSELMLDGLSFYSPDVA